jgi:hypothetical protein
MKDIRKRLAIAGLSAAAAFALALGAATSACSDSGPSGASPFVDASGGEPEAALIAEDGGPSLKPFVYPNDPGPGAFYVTISGESNALTGYPFPPADFGTDTYMVDGWRFEIFEYIVVVDKVTLWNNPNHDPTNQGDLSGMQKIAHLDGPFVVDLHKGGKIVGQGGAPELATPLGAITSQNDNGGGSFDTSGGTTYGFGFSTVSASYKAYNVNLDSNQEADFALMVEKGYSVLYVGTATWRGDDPSNPYPCTQTQAGAGFVAEAGADAASGYDFTRMPQSMTFKLGFATPTNYVNCQNMSLQGTPNPGEDYPRGVAASPNQSTIAQVTVHMDHPFWESFQEDTPVHWDQIAAQYVGVIDAGASGPVAHTEDFIGVAFHPFLDSTGTPLPWRNCVGMNYTPPGQGQMFFSTLSVPIDPQGTCTGKVGVDSTQDDCKYIRDYYDYIRYTQSTQGHLNSQGLCFIDRQFPAPAGGS